MLSATRPVDSQAFTAKLVREEQGRCHVFWCGGSRKIDSFRHPAVAVFLEDCLHSNVMSRVYVVGSDKEPPKIRGYRREMLNRFPMP